MVHLTGTSAKGHSPIHYNGDLLCAVDVGTSGLNYEVHELIQISIIPLQKDYTPSKSLRWFELVVRPERVNELNLDESKPWMRASVVNAMTSGMERWSAVDFLRDFIAKEWKLAPGKKVVPLGSNFVFDRDFIRNWCGGVLSYDEFFRESFRDIGMLARSINDIAEAAGEPVPFGRQSLGYLSNALKVENLRIHSSTHDAVATAEVYRRLLAFQYYFKFPVSAEQSSADSHDNTEEKQEAPLSTQSS